MFRPSTIGVLRMFCPHPPVPHHSSSESYKEGARVVIVSDVQVKKVPIDQHIYRDAYIPTKGMYFDFDLDFCMYFGDAKTQKMNPVRAK
jgi:hypothetical protein